MLIDKLVRLADQRAHPFVTDAVALGSLDRLHTVAIAMPVPPCARRVPALRCRSREAQHDLPLMLSPGRIAALTFAPVRVDGDEADLTAKRPSYDRVPGFVVGEGFSFARSHFSVYRQAVEPDDSRCGSSAASSAIAEPSLRGAAGHPLKLVARNGVYAQIS
jgi:hypothetical protein